MVEMKEYYLKLSLAATFLILADSRNVNRVSQKVKLTPEIEDLYNS